MSKPAEHLSAAAADLRSSWLKSSIWLKFSILMGIAAGALAAAAVYLSPAIAIAWLIERAVRQ